MRKNLLESGRYGVLIASLLIAAFMAGTSVPAWADGDIEAEETDETINNAVKSLRQDQREEEKAKSRLDALQRQHRETEFRKRTGAPFTSERSLRHDLRRNEAQQGWQKGESRRLEYETRRQQLDIRNQSRDWRRSQ